MTLRTWHVELAVVATLLFIVTAITGSRPIDWLSVLAVLYTFQHCQVTSRMAEAQAKMGAPSVECHRRATLYWVAKEFLWIAYFVIQRSWAAVAGAVVFAAYPAWRRYWRSK